MTEPPIKALIDTPNKFAVIAWHDRIHVMSVRRFMTGDGIDHEEALNLAAWLVAITGKRERFEAILNAVEAT
jgi:hypothetical protein